MRERERELREGERDELAMGWLWELRVEQVKHKGHALLALKP